MTVNSELVTLNWNIGKRIKTEIIKDRRAGRGEEAIATLSQQLTYEFGKGFTKSALLEWLGVFN